MCEAGAVEPLGILAAPAVGDAEVLFGFGDDGVDGIVGERVLFLSREGEEICCEKQREESEFFHR